MSECVVIAVANHKGGVAKTTTTAAFSAILYSKGFRVLAIDLDSSRNLSMVTKGYNRDCYTIYELLKQEPVLLENRRRRKITPEDCIQQGNETYDLIAADPRLINLARELSDEDDKAERLKTAISPIRYKYDFILLDCPPQLGLRYSNAFTAADEVLIVTEPAFFSTDSLAKVLETVSNAKNRTNPRLKIAGVLRTKYDPHIKDHRAWTEVLSNLVAPYETKLFETYIKKGDAPCSGAQTNLTNIFEYDKASRPARDYVSFVEEYLRTQNPGGTVNPPIS